ncbi:uncharacterized protein [Triticum aestivum]|uniref:uncharacterized protein n=1 Tax=Triticum aestivum TaxID=4565 RepID=UPI001D011DA9|nr:uncharacterized protein LOC123159212 [Triticum aestivum]
MLKFLDVNAHLHPTQAKILFELACGKTGSRSVMCVSLIEDGHPSSSWFMGLRSVRIYVNLCLIGPVHIDMEEAQRFIASFCGLALRGRPKQTSTCSSCCTVKSVSQMLFMTPTDRLMSALMENITRYILKDVLRLAPGLEVLKFTTIPHNFDLISRMSIEE